MAIFSLYRVAVQLYGDASKHVFFDIRAKTRSKANSEALKKAKKKFNTEFVKIEERMFQPHHKKSEWKMKYLLSGDLCSMGGFSSKVLLFEEMFEDAKWSGPSGMVPLSFEILNEFGVWENKIDDFENFLKSRKNDSNL